ncbi:MAG: TetR/AcrR family transcriptional regulator [Gemmatimonadota bacterium]
MTTLLAPKPSPVARRGRRSTQRKLDLLLEAAATLIAGQGFEATTIRDVGRKAEASLAGMYYYFASKEELLYQIQSRTFSSLLAAQEETAGIPGSAEERLRRLLVGHLTFFARHPNEMKVCTYEMESLKGEYYAQVEEVRRRYFVVMAEVVADLVGKAGKKSRESKVRRVTLYIFGMLNWVFMWHRPEKDGPVEELASEMFDLLIKGIGNGATAR